MLLTRQAFLRSLLIAAATPASVLLELSSTTWAAAGDAPRPAIGVYSGYGLYPANSAASVKDFEKVIGRPVDFISEYGSDKDWVDARSSPAHAIRTWRQVAVGSQRKLLWNQPLTVAGTPLSVIAAGKYDGVFREIATTLRTNGFYDAVVRIGWDMNASWVSWATNANTAADYIAAFRRVVGIFKEISPSFRICWSPSREEQIVAPETVYPGDDVVDFVGLSVVLKSLPADIPTAQYFERDIVGYGAEPKAGLQPYGLAWLDAFSRLHSKGMIIPEYGIGIDTSAGPLTAEQQKNQQTFIQLISEWIVNKRVALHCWRDMPETDWNSLNSRISQASSVAGRSPANPSDEKSNLALAFRSVWQAK